MKKLGALFLVLLFTACGGTVKVQSNRDPGFKDPHSRLVLVTRSHEKTETLFGYIERLTDSTLKARGIVATIHAENKLALDNSGLGAAVKAASADGVLMIGFAGASTINGTLSDMKVVGEFYSVPMAKTVWKSQLDVVPITVFNMVDERGTALRVATAIVDKLFADGIIASAQDTLPASVAHADSLAIKASSKAQ